MDSAGIAALVTAILGGTAAVVSAVAAAIAVLKKKKDHDPEDPRTPEEKAKEDLFNEYRKIVDLQRQEQGSLLKKVAHLEHRIERERDECHRSIEEKEIRIRHLEARVAELGG